jgi:hypothetical protein
MQLLSVLKNILIEQGNREDLGDFIDEDGDTFNVVATIHSQETTAPNTRSGRVDVNTIGDVIFEFSDVFSEVSKSIINDPKKTSILVRDYLNRFDFIVSPHINNDGTYGLNIITSILYPKKLSYKPENRLIIIKNDGDLVVEQFLFLDSFTKLERGNIIIYYER